MHLLQTQWARQGVCQEAARLVVVVPGWTLEQAEVAVELEVEERL